MTARSVSWTDPQKIAALLSQVASPRPADRKAAVPAMGALLPAHGPRGRAGGGVAPTGTPKTPSPGAQKAPFPASKQAVSPADG